MVGRNADRDGELSQEFDRIRKRLLAGSAAGVADRGLRIAAECAGQDRWIGWSA